MNFHKGTVILSKMENTPPPLKNTLVMPLCTKTDVLGPCLLFPECNINRTYYHESVVKLVKVHNLLQCSSDFKILTVLS